MLALPFFVLALFRRFLPEKWALAAIVTFVAIPVGLLFGSSYLDYVKWAARGFADPAAYALFIAGFVLLARGEPETADGFWPAFWSALLLALAVFTRANLIPMAGLFLAWATWRALLARQGRRIAGLVVGFLPVLLMPLHNWVFGHVFVLFTSAPKDTRLYVLPPAKALAALGELVRLDVAGDNAKILWAQIARFLEGPSESWLLIPVHLAAFVLLVWIVGFGRRFDPWLRVIAFALIVQALINLPFLVRTRYFFMYWLFALVIVLQWIRLVGIDLVRQWSPRVVRSLLDHPFNRRIADGVLWLERIAAPTNPAG